MDDMTDSGAPAEESGNRTFVIVAAVLGGIVLLTIACLAIYALVIMPGQRDTAAQAQATVAAQNTAVAQGLTQTAVVNNLTLTPQASPVPSRTPTSSPTPLIAQPTTSTPLVGGGLDPAAATLAAQNTLVAQLALTVIPTTTALPATGFADEIGAPGLLFIGFVLIAVILLSRQLRKAGAAR